jgi:rubrerythrin
VLELALGLAEAAGEIGQLPGPEQQQQDSEDEEELRATEVHGEVFGATPPGGWRRADSSVIDDDLWRRARGADELHEQFRRHSRRRFVRRAVLGGVVAAVGSGAPGFVRPAAAQAQSDRDLVLLGESVELGLVACYDAMAATGKLEPAIADVGARFADHHREHAALFQAILGDESRRTPNRGMLDTFVAQIEAESEQPPLIELAYALEEAAASTCLFAVGALEDAEHAAAVATILAVESQHAVTLAGALGKDAATYLPVIETDARNFDDGNFPIS